VDLFHSGPIERRVTDVSLDENKINHFHRLHLSKRVDQGVIETPSPPLISLHAKILTCERSDDRSKRSI
jgi:hypothetical protein